MLLMDVKGFDSTCVELTCECMILGGNLVLLWFAKALELFLVKFNRLIVFFNECTVELDGGLYIVC